MVLNAFLLQDAWDLDGFAHCSQSESESDDKEESDKFEQKEKMGKIALALGLSVGRCRGPPIHQSSS
jgi:hypothetical protein